MAAAPATSPSLDQLIAGWQAMFPGADIPQGMQQAKALGLQNYGAGAAFSTINTPSGNPISLSQLVAAAPQAATAAPAAAPAQSQGYLASAPTISAGTATGAPGAPGGTSTMANGQQPEQVALQQMGQIDPATEQLRQQLAASYLTPLAQSGAPSAGQFQNLLSVYGQVDPTGAAARAKLGRDLAAQEALGTQLDPATQRQLEQQTRIAQGARGNVYGTPQLVQEAMTTGQAGLALQQQRQQALQGYLTSGATTGDLAMNLYAQQQNQLRASQQAALGYMGSGQTPYQAGASYLNTAEQRAANAAQGGTAYQPQGPSGYYTGQGAASFPQYGLDTSQTAANWYNLMNAYNPQQQGGAGKSAGGQAAKAGVGALSGAVTGAVGGAAVGGVGAIPGAIVGALGGAASGYFS